MGKGHGLKGRRQEQAIAALLSEATVEQLELAERLCAVEARLAALDEGQKT
jgi:hypothetical protein